MFKAHLSLVLVTALQFSSDATSAPHESLVRKCRNTVQGTPLIFVDGRNTTDSALKQVATVDIRSLEVVCLSALDTTLMAPGSSAPGVGGIIVWTKLGPSSQLEPALSELRKAQQAHFARTGAYSRDRASLQLPALPDDVQMSIEVTTNGWSASAWLARRFSPRCRVSDGGASAADPKSKGVIDCSGS